MIDKEVSSFIIDNLKKIHALLKCVSLKYEYDKYSMMHIVEVMPLETYKEKESYINWEIDLTNQLADKYPTEEILFVSEDSLTKVTAPSFTLLPKLTISSTKNNNFYLTDNIAIQNNSTTLCRDEFNMGIDYSLAS